ncbi:MAG TPA: lactococcin 972 family bacteriocin [Staphylococcus sp.]|nr:lactococcin 972 family bacteriocin [Staphylococcus sp.]
MILNEKSLVLGTVLTVGISMIGISGIASANDASMNGGSENVDYYKGLVKTETHDVENQKVDLKAIKQGRKSGGFWIRGIRGKIVVSDYKHYRKYGKGTAINGNGFVGSGGWKSPGDFSYGRVVKTLYGNKVYYDHK